MDRLERRSTPLIEPVDGGVRLTFTFRAPPGTAQVLIDVNGVTDHHSHVPTLMSRVGETDEWSWTTVVRSDFRGTYRFVPVSSDEDVRPPDPGDPRQPGIHREWWLSMLEHSVADPTNPYAPVRTPWQTPVSPIHLPGAPAQPEWTAFDRGEPGPTAQPIEWTSPTLGNTRRVWAYQVGEPDRDQPLVLLLDGETWAERMPVFAALDAAARRGLPSCLCVLVGSIDLTTRARELPCHTPFWDAIRHELLPRLAETSAFTTDPARTVVAGQSYGGLSAVFAVLRWPERFGAAASQSGSFWWPDLERPRAGTRVRVVQNVGRLERRVIRDGNTWIRDALVDAGHDVTYRTYEGGHELLCWRGALIDALVELLG